MSELLEAAPVSNTAPAEPNVTTTVQQLLAADYLVQMLKPEYDREVLCRKNFDVNLRLLRRSPQYRSLIEQTIEYMKWTLDNEFDDYKSNPQGGTFGISGANLGIPWRIIGFKSPKGVTIMINPTIIRNGKELHQGRTNCGSILLKDKITVQRYKDITVKYYDIHGVEHIEAMAAAQGCYTVQHEIDHTYGILITDRYGEQNKITSRGSAVKHMLPEEYQKRLREGEGITLDATLTKRVVYVVLFEGDDEKQNGLSWFNDEFKANGHVRLKKKTHKTVRLIRREVPLTHSNSQITNELEKSYSTLISQTDQP